MGGVQSEPEARQAQQALALVEPGAELELQQSALRLKRLQAADTMYKFISIAQQILEGYLTQFLVPGRVPNRQEAKDMAIMMGIMSDKLMDFTEGRKHGPQINIANVSGDDLRREFQKRGK